MLCPQEIEDVKIGSSPFYYQSYRGPWRICASDSIMTKSAGLKFLFPEMDAFTNNTFKFCFSINITSESLCQKAWKQVTILADIMHPDDYESMILPIHIRGGKNTSGSQEIHHGVSWYSLPNSDSRLSSTDTTVWEGRGDQRFRTFRNEGLDFLVT